MAQSRVISISRRSDIPAYYSKWLMGRISEGYCHVLNPFNNSIRRRSLLPEDTAGIVFWSRNPRPLFRHLKTLKSMGYAFYFHFTITGYPDFLEPRTPLIDKALRNFRELSDQIGPKAVHWRYDPILLSRETPLTYHIENFARIAAQLEGYTQFCTFSFAHFYRKTRNNLALLEKEKNLFFGSPSDEEKNLLFGKLASIAHSRGIRLQGCCVEGISHPLFEARGCVSDSYLSLVKGEGSNHSIKSTRKGCQCMDSIDIGAYNSCLSGCLYCYATHNQKTALRVHRGYDPGDSLLLRPNRFLNKDLSVVIKEQEMAKKKKSSPTEDELPLQC